MFTIPNFISSKRSGRKIAMLTCYDALTAALLEQSGIDAVLVGDSVAMVVHGMPSTTTATMTMMIAHVRAVRAGSPNLCIVADMPFLSTRRGLAKSVDAARSLIQAGANAVKIEGLSGHERLIPALVGGGVPVMGHLGLQPQSVNALGGYSRQGRNPDEAESIRKDALELERLGCFALVLECVPGTLGAAVSDELEIPTIGIGAGAHCDGQILVSTDMLGLNSGYVPSFVRTYAVAGNMFADAFSAFADDVRSGAFPATAAPKEAKGGVA